MKEGEPCLNPLTRIHCLPTLLFARFRVRLEFVQSQSPDEDSLSSDPYLRSARVHINEKWSQSPDEDSLSSDPWVCAAAVRRRRTASQSPDEDSLSSDTKGGETHGLDVLDAFVSIP